jgi:hypothetical protein
MSLLVLQSFPLTIPRLKDFRSLVTLSYHQKSLIESPISPRPFAIVEAIDIIDRYILSFVKTYQFHELEIEYMKSNLDFMGRTFRVFLRNNLSKNIRKNLFKPPQESRFSISEFAKHMIGNYKIHSAEMDVNNSTSNASSSEASFVPLINTSLASVQQWYGDGNANELIEAIAEAAIPEPPVVGEVRSHESDYSEDMLTEFDQIFHSKELLKDFIVTALKILLTACRGITSDSPMSHGTLDLDREHLVIMLEKFDCLRVPDLIENRLKNFEIINSTICGIFQIILSKNISFAESIFIANNGCLVLLKLITNAPEDGMEIIKSNRTSIFPFINSSISYHNGIPNPSATALFRAMKCLYSICRKNPGRIKKYLIHYKLGVILKRFFKVPNYSIQKISYKLLKIQMRYLNKKWKMMHIKLASNCFAITQTNVIDDWLTNDPDVLPINPLPEDPEDILNDSITEHKIPIHRTKNIINDLMDYSDSLMSLDFTDDGEIYKFCKKFNESNFFCGSKNFDEFIIRSLGI